MGSKKGKYDNVFGYIYFANKLLIFLCMTHLFYRQRHHFLPHNPTIVNSDVKYQIGSEIFYF